MSKIKETPARTLVTALVLCLFCSVVVSAAALMLRPIQESNAALDKQRSVLRIAGLLEPGMRAEQIREVYASRITPRLVELSTGEYSDAFDPNTFDQGAAAKNPQLSRVLSKEEDLASIRRLEQYAVVYLVHAADSDAVDRIVLPVRGYGLWSTMYGFLALEMDLTTVAGLGFYQHGETPGLGGEITNPNWLAQWPGKQVFADGEPVLRTVKGGIASGNHQVDALAGATITSDGVTHMVQFWLGREGFLPFLNKLAQGEA